MSTMIAADAAAARELDGELDPSSPGAHALLADTERRVERGLHLARAVYWVGLWAVMFFVLGVAYTAPVAVTVATFALTIVVWWIVWRAIADDRTRSWLRYLLIVMDAFAVVRPVVFASLPHGLVTGVFGDFTPAREDVLAVTPALLVYVALSGAFRMDPRPAALSTAAATVAWTIVAAVLGLAAHQALGTAAIIVLVGLLGTRVASTLRGFALRASAERVLAHYVPSALTRELVRSGDPERAAYQRQVTVLIADIRGFTALVEPLSPSAAMALLNAYFADVVAPLVAEGGIVTAYLGDGLLAFFEGDDRSRRALRAVRGMRDALAAFNARRPPAEQLRIGIALHAGEVLLGTIGAPAQRQYTIVGDVVNVTDRLEKWNKELGSAVIASVSALAGIDPKAEGFAGPTRVELRGHAEPIVVHYLPAAPSGAGAAG